MKTLPQPNFKGQFRKTPPALQNDLTTLLREFWLNLKKNRGTLILHTPAEEINYFYNYNVPLYLKNMQNQINK